MKKEVKKMNNKSRIKFAVISGVGFATTLYLMDLFSTEKTQTFGGLLFQGVFFGVLFGLGYPYLSEKFGGKFASKNEHKNEPPNGKE